MGGFENLDKGLEYIESLQAIPYGYWNGKLIPRDDTSSFYVSGEDLPSRALLCEQGISCTGVLNLLCRVLNLEVPDHPHFPGGTAAWGAAVPWTTPLPPTEYSFEPGTLLLRFYKSFSDQGHVAVISRDRKHFIHSIATPWDPLRQEVRTPGVTLDKITEENLNFYHALSSPEIWIKSLKTISKASSL